MQISKNSWAYRVCVWAYPSNSLCVFFWQVVWSLMLWPILGAIALLAIFVLLCLPIISILSLFISYEFSHDFIGSGFIILVIELGVAFIFGLTFIIDRYKYKVIVPQHIKAKKEKICPVIEFVED